MHNNTAAPPPRHSDCQVTNQIPARTAPMRPITAGPATVALSSNPTLTVRATAMWTEPYPAESRYVTICPENDSTVRYSSAPANDGSTHPCPKYARTSSSAPRIPANRRAPMPGRW
ncbi:hypothetical protein SLS55_006781 [Diplodia seriata]|uniref:Uncharacterized protein n=1 Tax=Diplodia seriata TaxID=420778 RepID=A0ABR3CG92_9PEZI